VNAPIAVAVIPAILTLLLGYWLGTSQERRNDNKEAKNAQEQTLKDLRANLLNEIEAVQQIQSIRLESQGLFVLPPDEPAVRSYSRAYDLIYLEAPTIGDPRIALLSLNVINDCREVTTSPNRETVKKSWEHAKSSYIEVDRLIIQKLNT